LLDEQDKLADVLTAETGRPRAEAYGNELFYLCDAIGLWAKRSAGYLRPEKIRPHFPLMWLKKVVTTYSPRGVIGIISPWNFPLTLTLGEALPALMAGNAVVIKPSELTPLSALFGAEMAGKAGFPNHLLQVVIGSGETGEARALPNRLRFTGLGDGMSDVGRGRDSQFSDLLQGRRVANFDSLSNHGVVFHVRQFE